MRGIPIVSLIHILGFSLLVRSEDESFVGEVIARAHQAPPDGPTKRHAGKGPNSQILPATASVVTSTIINEVTIIFSGTDITLPTISSPSTSGISSQATVTVTFIQAINSPITPTSSPTAMTPPVQNTSQMETTSSSSSSAPQRTLVIVLSTILGSIGILLVSLVLFLACRYRKRKAFRRGVSPINDEEIESWRNKERKQPLPSAPRGLINTVTAGRISPDWTWVSSGNVQPPPRALTRGPSLLAKAPNARVGLTTEVVPGEAPFIPIAKRQSSRLSKSQPSHIRTKSMRSSTSARSMRSMNGGSVGVIDFTLSEEGVPRWHTSESRGDRSNVYSGIGTSSPATSVYVAQTEAGGLSPRPKSRQWGEKPPQQNDSPDWPISWN